jgi:hypothetical protein
MAKAKDETTPRGAGRRWTPRGAGRRWSEQEIACAFRDVLGSADHPIARNIFDRLAAQRTRRRKRKDQAYMDIATSWSFFMAATDHDHPTAADNAKFLRDFRQEIAAAGLRIGSGRALRRVVARGQLLFRGDTDRVKFVRTARAFVYG